MWFIGRKFSDLNHGKNSARLYGPVPAALAAGCLGSGLGLGWFYVVAEVGGIVWVFLRLKPPVQSGSGPFHAQCQGLGIQIYLDPVFDLSAAMLGGGFHEFKHGIDHRTFSAPT